MLCDAGVEVLCLLVPCVLCVLFCALSSWCTSELLTVFKVTGESFSNKIISMILFAREEVFLFARTGSGSGTWHWQGAHLSLFTQRPVFCLKFSFPL